METKGEFKFKEVVMTENKKHYVGFKEGPLILEDGTLPGGKAAVYPVNNMIKFDDKKVLLPGLNTILYTHEGQDTITQFCLSSKMKLGIDYLDPHEFTADELGVKITKNRDDDIITISLLEVEDKINLTQFGRNVVNKIPGGNNTLIEQSDVVLKYDAENDNFLIIKHRKNRNLCGTRVSIDLLM